MLKFILLTSISLSHCANPRYTHKSFIYNGEYILGQTESRGFPNYWHSCQQIEHPDQRLEANNTPVDKPCIVPNEMYSDAGTFEASISPQAMNMGQKKFYAPCSQTHSMQAENTTKVLKHLDKPTECGNNSLFAPINDSKHPEYNQQVKAQVKHDALNLLTCNVQSKTQAENLCYPDNSKSIPAVQNSHPECVMNYASECSNLSNKIPTVFRSYFIYNQRFLKPLAENESYIKEGKHLLHKSSSQQEQNILCNTDHVYEYINDSSSIDTSNIIEPQCLAKNEEVSFTHLNNLVEDIIGQNNIKPENNEISHTMNDYSATNPECKPKLENNKTIPKSFAEQPTQSSQNKQNEFKLFFDKSELSLRLFSLYLIENPKEGNNYTYIGRLVFRSADIIIKDLDKFINPPITCYTFQRYGLQASTNLTVAEQEYIESRINFFRQINFDIMQFYKLILFRINQINAVDPLFRPQVPRIFLYNKLNEEFCAKYYNSLEEFGLFDIKHIISPYQSIVQKHLYPIRNPHTWEERATDIIDIE